MCCPYPRGSTGSGGRHHSSRVRPKGTRSHEETSARPLTWILAARSSISPCRCSCMRASLFRSSPAASARASAADDLVDALLDDSFRGSLREAIEDRNAVEDLRLHASSPTDDADAEIDEVETRAFVARLRPAELARFKAALDGTAPLSRAPKGGPRETRSFVLGAEPGAHLRSARDHLRRRGRARRRPRGCGADDDGHPARPHAGRPRRSAPGRRRGPGGFGRRPKPRASRPCRRAGDEGTRANAPPTAPTEGAKLRAC